MGLALLCAAAHHQRVEAAGIAKPERRRAHIRFLLTFALVRIERHATAKIKVQSLV
jgi:hypothetical protein